MVLGFPLPSWQRPLRWSDHQMVHFLESIWMGIPFGFYVLNTLEWMSGGKPHPMSGLLFDGQQRFFALQRYFDDELEVFGVKFSELERVDRRRFLNTPFPSYETFIFDEDQGRDLYNRLNFGGTPHEPDEKA